MKIVLKKSDGLDDWYTIERAHHENRHWLEPTGQDSVQLMYSGRISDACVEGTAAEMIEIAKAIKSRGAASFKRCAVRVDGEHAYFCSPRNSERDAGISLVDADEFADQALAELTTPNAQVQPTAKRSVAGRLEPVVGPDEGDA